MLSACSSDVLIASIVIVVVGIAMFFIGFGCCRSYDGAQRAKEEQRAALVEEVVQKMKDGEYN
jgi:hypothetical protein